MTEELTLIAVDDGVAIVGDPVLARAFVEEQGLASQEFSLGRLSAKLGAAAGAAEAASNAAASSGRWLKVTAESAAKIKEFGLTPTGVKGVSHAMIGPAGSMKSWIQVETRAASQLANPALLSGAAGIMSQLAMQQAINEIGDYLERIDEKLDDVLRAQKSAALAPMRGTAFDIDEAMAIREARGRVDDVTWSKVQGRTAAISDLQALAIDHLERLAGKLEGKAAFGDLADASERVRAEVNEWLAVLARSFQLQDALAVLELDRVLDASPEELDRHRLGLSAARLVRLQRIADATGAALARLDATVQHANGKVLLHPSKAPAIASACTDAALSVIQLNRALGIDHGGAAPEARRWSRAVRDTGSKAFATGADGVGAARRAGGDAASRAKATSERVAGQARRLRERGGDGA